MSHRTERLNNLIREEVGKILHEELEFGLGILVTVTNAQVSGDASYARIYISILPQKYTGTVLKILRKNIYHIQKVLGKERKVKPTPKIEFVPDRGIENFENVEKIIDSN